jgi:hypothetical protein
MIQKNQCKLENPADPFVIDTGGKISTKTSRRGVNQVLVWRLQARRRNPDVADLADFFQIRTKMDRGDTGRQLAN